MRVLKFIKEEDTCFLFEVFLPEFNLETNGILIKESGEMMIQLDDVAKKMGFETAEDLLGQDESLDALNESVKEYYYTPLQMLEIRQGIALIEDKVLRESLISKLGVE